ncbi:uncharacterized protein LOC110682830 [Chenopodium quinoa]|uniref:uncharacterized protein LOC110682830 n=1 Tax=Chenopodium quinoa TaxID=63459 RepID=UPI000B78227B|nr:uncharacterized protein LOC110682830 [Chenopodium quinoa]
MKVALWNCRGLGQADSPKIPYITSLVRSHGVDILCLLETMLSVDSVVRKLASLPFLGCCGIDADGLSGVMFICRFTPLGLVPVYSSQNVYLCKLVQGDEIKHVMFVYGSPHVTNRSEIWYLISNIIESLSNVIIIGDFNQVEYFSDKLGGNLSIPGQMEFINWHMGLDLVDVPFPGPRYTWTYNRLDLDPIFEHLNRAYASPTWFLEYLDTRLTHQPILFSDHAAIILADSADYDDIKQPYKIENWCLSVPAIHDIISSIFSMFFPGSPMFALSRKLSVSRDRLLAWCISHKKAWGINWKQLVFDIHQASRFLDTRVDRCLFISTKNEKVAEAQAAYIFWQQRAKIKWDALGDSHSRILFSSVQSRKRNNRIFGLRDSNGECHRNPNQIASITQAFYKDLFTTSASTSSYDEEWWDNWNLTFLTLLPKVDNPEVISQFCPIGLCNVIYKCAAKCLTSRLRQVLPSLVADFQNAFVPGRLLSDNALIAHEVISFMNKSKAKKRFYAAIKLDMNKAYDRVNWEFLFRLLQAYGFPPYWIHIIRQCVSTISYQVLVNGNPLQNFRPQCGLRQGDPLSSYLFVLCMEILSAMIRKAERASLFKGICISRSAPMVSYLFFADDSLLFLQVTPEACENLSGLLSEFCSLSGQVINLQKSFVKFSPNTPEDYKDFLARRLKLQSKPTLGSNLGLPVDLGRNKVSDFSFLIDKVVQRLTAFASLGLSSAAKLVIINSVLVASFNHVLSVFHIPTSICSKIDNLLARFWWKSDFRSRGLALRSKTLLHLPKGLGGLGIRRLSSFNTVLLARQCWRIHHHPQLLVYRLLSAKYPSIHNLQTRRIPGSSWGCQGLRQGLSILSDGAAWKVAFGAQVRILEDSWVPGESISFRDNCEAPLPSHVSSIINSRSYAWDTSMVHNLFDSSTSNRILALERLSRPMDDFVYWKFTKDGCFNAKSAYAMMLRRLDYNDGASYVSSSWWKMFWGLPLMPKLQCFCWKLLHDALPLNGVLQLRGVPVDSTCVFCLTKRETVDHLFRDYPFTTPVRSRVSIISSIDARQDVSFIDWFVNLVADLRQAKSWEILVNLVSFLWAVWIACNHKVFRQAVISPDFIHRIMQDWVSRSSTAQDFKVMVKASTSGSRIERSSPSSYCCVRGFPGTTREICLICDGAFNARDYSAGAGCIFRIPDSDWVLGGVSRAFISSSALHSKLQACLWALKAADRRGFSRLLVYTDYATLFHFVQNKNGRDIACLWIFQEILDVINRFSTCDFRKVPRQWVVPAHWLVGQACRRQLLFWSV